jgi:DNA-binding MarR family transcriptional regulator
VLLTLTEHGRIAAKVIRTASTAVERELAQQVSAHDLAALRRALAVLASDT